MGVLQHLVVLIVMDKKLLLRQNIEKLNGFLFTGMTNKDIFYLSVRRRGVLLSGTKDLGGVASDDVCAFCLQSPWWFPIRDSEQAGLINFGSGVASWCPQNCVDLLD